MNEIATFSVARLAEIRFGAGRIAEIPQAVARFGNQALLVTGGRSFMATPHRARLQAPDASAADLAQMHI